LEWFKAYRLKGNMSQKEAYRGMLRFIHLRFKLEPHRYITMEEIKLLNVALILLENGWVFEEGTLNQALEISGADKTIEIYKANIGTYDDR